MFDGMLFLLIFFLNYGGEEIKLIFNLILVVVEWIQSEKFNVEKQFLKYGVIFF